VQQLLQLGKYALLVKEGTGVNTSSVGTLACHERAPRLSSTLKLTPTPGPFARAFWVAVSWGLVGIRW
jgi:hypothetical protein